jgi:hypothetical protein
MKKIKLTQGKWALVDDEDYEYLNQFCWCYLKQDKDRYGYAIRSGYDPITRARPRIAMHRVVVKAKKGDIVDHINFNGLDNRRSNLRIVDRFQSAWNKRAKSKKTSGPQKGVSIVRDRHGVPSYWIARITRYGKRKYLGTFPTERKAAAAYINASIKYHGKYRER